MILISTIKLSSISKTTNIIKSHRRTIWYLRKWSESLVRIMYLNKSWKIRKNMQTVQVISRLLISVLHHRVIVRTKYLPHQRSWWIRQPWLEVAFSTELVLKDLQNPLTVKNALNYKVLLTANHFIITISLTATPKLKSILTNSKGFTIRGRIQQEVASDLQQMEDRI